MYIADLHIHSRYSRATSRDLTPEALDLWARRKGIHLVGTGDFTHPAWRQELRKKLKAAEEGLYTLAPSLEIKEEIPGSKRPRFVITGEISSIYKKNGRVRKVHSLIILPGLDEAEALSKKLEAIGNLHSDGRPILGLDCRDLLEITMEVCPKAIYIPAHIWTPHFSLFGAFSGFDRIEECYEDMTPYIHALETGLSSDPPMNWRLSALDDYFLVSNSDAHSPAKLGREANLLDIELSYDGLYEALQRGKGLCGTIEFFPEEGKYHFDGHRKCHVCLSPKEAEALGNRCPVCGKKLTMGVDHRVEQLADRSGQARSKAARDFESLVPLPEVIASATGHSASGPKTQRIYEDMIGKLGTEFSILRETPPEEIKRCAGPQISEGIRRLRQGRVKRIPGFDGEYGVIRLFEPWELEELEGQMSLFGLPGMELPQEKPRTEKEDSGMGEASRTGDESSVPPQEKEAVKEAAASLQKEEERLNPAQEQAVRSLARTTAVIAGPGTGKTRTLVEKIIHMLQERRVSPGEITAVTFTNRAAQEMRRRLEGRLHRKRALQAMKIGTFHSVCYELLKKQGTEVFLLKEQERQEVANQVMRELKLDLKPARLLEEISGRKVWDQPLGEAGELYQRKLGELGAMDFDDLLLETLKGLEAGTIADQAFRYLLVDEFQDINPLQYRLIRRMNQNGHQLFVIGDPDQSIYGFRGSDSRCFDHLKKEEPELEVIYLRENYRSCGKILEAAQSLIFHNPGPARILNPHREEGLVPRLVTATGELGESVFVAKEINRMVGGIDMLDAQEGFLRPEEKKTRSFGDIALLYRTHRQGRLLERCLKQEGIPYVVAGREEFLEADVVRGSLCFFDCLAGRESPMTQSLCQKLLWKENGISDEAWSRLLDDFRPLYGRQKPARFLASWAETLGKREDENLEKLCAMAPFYRSMEEMARAIQYGGESDLKRCGQKTYTSDSVTLMTFHGAKGLEFPVVILCGLREGLLPLVTAKGETDVEEERRLFYVGITRAMEELVMTSWGKESPFLEELGKERVLRESAARKMKQEAHQISLFELDLKLGGL